MSKYRGPKLKVTRRFQNSSLPGLTRKISDRCPPGVHGPNMKKGGKSQDSDYKVRLLEKQKLRYNYLLSENQLLRYVKMAKKMKGVTGSILIQLLEMRLDNIVFRLGLAPTIPSARQIVCHGHIVVNNKKVDLPSFQCVQGDKISIRDKKTSKNLITYFNQSGPSLLEKLPKHLMFDKETLTGEIIKKFDNVDASIKINELLIVEYYSRKC